MRTTTPDGRIPSHPPCPLCRTNAKVKRMGPKEYICKRCKGLFDSDPNEGGDYSSYDPSARIERQEWRQRL